MWWQENIAMSLSTFGVAIETSNLKNAALAYYQVVSYEAGDKGLSQMLILFAETFALEIDALNSLRMRGELPK